RANPRPKSSPLFSAPRLYPRSSEQIRGQTSSPPFPPFPLSPRLSAPFPRKSAAKTLLLLRPSPDQSRRATISQLLNGVLPYRGRNSTARLASPSVDSSSARVG